MGSALREGGSAGALAEVGHPCHGRLARWLVKCFRTFRRPPWLALRRHWAEPEISMTTLLIGVGALFVAVVGWTLLDPWPSPATGKSKDQADQERAQMMETIALSFF
jgi:hypothetical protein